MTMRCDELAPVRARRRLAELPDLGWALGDAMLVVSELVTNAVRHSLCSEADELAISVERLDDSLRVSVRDPGVSGRMARIAEEPRWFGGVGLRIVQQLTARWGSRRHADGYEVWAELPLVATGRVAVHHSRGHDSRARGWASRASRSPRAWSG